MNTIVAVTNDPGGSANVVPVVRELRRRGVMSHLFTTKGGWFDGNSPSDLSLPVLTTDSDNIGDLIPDILITSMDSNVGNVPNGPNLGRDMAMLMPRGKVVVAITDGWDGAQVNPAIWAKRECRPDYIIVNDKTGAQMVLETNPWLGSDCVKILGWPALDALAGRDLANMHREARAKLGIPESEFVIIFCGQLQYTGEGLMKLVRAIDNQKKRVTLIARPHPRMGTDPVYTKERERWDEALAFFRRNNLGEIKDSSHIKDGNEVLAAADLAVSLNSNMLRDATIMGIDCICIRDHIPTKDRTRFPLIELGCAFDTAGQASLSDLVEQAINERICIEEIRGKAFRLDGMNTKRVADFITTLL